MREKIITNTRILLGVAAGPGLLLILPFLLNASDYGRLFGFVAVVQLLSQFSSLGFEIVAARVNMPFRVVIILLAITTFLVTLVYELANAGLVSSFVAAMAFGTALSNNICLVIQNRYLFRGDAARYALFGACRAVLLILVLLIFVHAKFEIVTSWVVASVVSIFVPYLWLRPPKERSRRSGMEELTVSAMTSVLYAALPMAIINSLAGLPFIAERLIAKAAFDSVLFPKYAICATLMAPMVYLGNMTQNYLISHNLVIGRHSALEGMRQLVILCGGYLIVLFSMIFFVLPPYFYSRSEFYAVALPSGLWVFIYCVISFPLAAITQKHADTRTLAKCAIGLVVAVILLYGCYELLVRRGVMSLNVPWKTALGATVLSLVIMSVRARYMWPLTKHSSTSAVR